MATKKEKTKEQRIKTEKTRLKGIFKDLDENKKKLENFFEENVNYGLKNSAEWNTMNFIKSDVSTICLGMAASMAAFLLSSGKKGKRYALPNSEVMIHQPLGGASGQATEIKIAAEHILNTKKKLNDILAKNTGKSIKQIENDTDRDNYLSADNAKDYGLIDKILTNQA